MNLLEMFGYAGSLVVLISLMMSSIKMLRWINLAGALMFTLYAVLIKAWPAAFMNFGIVIIDVYYLIKLYKTKESFKLIRADRNSDFFKEFMGSHKEDMENFFHQPELGDEVYYMMRGGQTAGLLAGKRLDDESFLVTIDYVISDFRDGKLGQYLYSEGRISGVVEGVKKVLSTSFHSLHTAYLKKQGFIPGENDLYVKRLGA